MAKNQMIEDYEKGFPVARVEFQNSTIMYGAPNQIAYWRASTLHTKEPETVKWVAGFKKDEVFVDVGANIGLYSILAAVHASARVFAFEPESENYALLNRNIRLNNVSDRVVAWCCALTDHRCVDRLYMTNVEAAQSGHEFGAEVDPSLRPTKAAFAQGSLGYSLDEFVALKALPAPNHIKIDVDGIEHLVVKGAQETFARQELKSVLIEISPHIEEHVKLIETMATLGFAFDPDQVERATRKEGSTKGFAEYIFQR